MTAATQLTSRHRSTDPVPVPGIARRTSSGSHRASRASDVPIAAILGIILLLLTAYLAVRG